MNEIRRNLLNDAAALGVGALAASAILLAPETAEAQPPVSLAQTWKSLEIGKTYTVNAPFVVIVAIIKQKNGRDFRGAIHGEVDGQLRATACAGWSPASGMSTNSMMMFANRGQRFKITKADDFGNKYGLNWDVTILVSGPCV